MHCLVTLLKDYDGASSTVPNLKNHDLQCMIQSGALLPGVVYHPFNLFQHE